jgi:hypothetical protein
MDFVFLYLISAAVTVTASQSIPPKIINSIAKTMAAVHMARPSSPYASSSSDNDSMNTPTGTALRRLYFQSGKSSKFTNGTKSSIPKVIVKNSSCNSTINTSTDSASTHLTNVTTATDTETFDSLDSGKKMKFCVTNK